MKENNQREIEFIDVKSHESEIEWDVRSIKRACEEAYLIKVPYILKLRKFFFEDIEHTSEKIYSRIMLEKECKNWRFSKSEVKELIKSGAEQFIDKYIRSALDNMGGCTLDMSSMKKI